MHLSSIRYPNYGSDAPPPRIHLGQMGFPQDLGIRADLGVQNLIIRNLTADQPIHSYRYTANSFSHRIRVLGSHIMQNKKEYAKTIAWTVAFVALCIGTVLAAKFIIAYLAALKADILLGKPIVDIFGTVEVAVLEGWKYYTLAVIAYPTWVFIACLCSTGVGIESYHSILKIKQSFVKFLSQHPCKDFERQTFQFTAKDLSRIQNNLTENQTYEDCISLELMSKDWIQAPRFIQIGTMIYSLNSILAYVMSAPWINDGLKHPHESRKFTVPEQTDLMNNLAGLFAMDTSEITQCLVQHHCDLRRSQFLKKLPAAVLDHRILLNKAGEEGSSFTLRECLQT